jgi:hypothetical protein
LGPPAVCPSVLHPGRKAEGFTGYLDYPVNFKQMADYNEIPRHTQMLKPQKYLLLEKV